MPLSTGQTLHNNRYRIAKLIGEGGFGAVYRAWDTVLNQPVAVKENLDTTGEAQKQFEREARMMAGLRHPNLPRVMDHFFLPGQGQYLVMDFVEGHSLAALLAAQQGQPFAEADVLPWLQQVCNALDYLHNRQPPIIHRDIKPENIIITPEGQAMLVDFGISKVYDTQLATTVGARAVTPGYSPPEQYGAGKTDARTDIYALGATLYRMLTGVEPPPSVDVVSGADNLAQPRQLNPQLSAAAEQAILQAMATNMSQRFSRASEMLAALTTMPPQPAPRAPANPDHTTLPSQPNITRSVPDAVRKSQPISHNTKFLVSNLGWLIVGGVIVGMLAIFLNPDFWGKKSGGNDNAIIASPVAELTIISPTSTPAQCDILYAAGWQGEGIYALNIKEGQIVEALATSLYNNRFLVWNNIRDEIYIAADNGGVISIIKTNPLQEIGTISENVGWNAQSVAVSPDGNRIYATFSTGGGNINNRRVEVLDPISRRSLHTIELDNAWGNSFLALSPDGQQLYVSWDSYLDIYYTADMSLFNRIRNVITESGRLVVSDDGRYLFIVQPNQLLKFEIRTQRVISSLPLEMTTSGYEWIELSREGDKLWIAGVDMIYQVPISFETISIIQAQSPIGFTESTDGSVLFVSSLDMVSTVEVSTGKLISEFQVPNAAGLLTIPCE